MINRPEGTQDLIAQECDEWSKFVQVAKRVCALRGYLSIETPTFEREDLFKRGIGEATDVVSKEMYSAISGGNLNKLLNGETLNAKSKLSLRPEGTAGVVRAAIQNGLIDEMSQPVKLMYAGSMFRAERPQKGRLREFHQFGIECLGSTDPILDVQAIETMMSIFEEYGIDKTKTKCKINSMGCKKCRPQYRDAVFSYLKNNTEHLCETCNTRAEINPLRAFDCKNEKCHQVMKNAPKISDYLCDECKDHFKDVTELLNEIGINYQLDETLVRGLDYYTRTVFECVFTDGLGAQNAIGGGGRYDGLVEDLGGKPTPGLGFALGFERCKLAAEQCGTNAPTKPLLDVFLIPLCEEARDFASKMMFALIKSNLSVEMDFREVEGSSSKIRSFKSQLKLADKLNAKYAVVIGEDELSNSSALIKNLQTHEEQIVDFSDIKDFLLENK